MSENAHNLEQLQSRALHETAEDIDLIKGALGRLHSSSEKQSKEIIQSRNNLARLRTEYLELKNERDELLQECKAYGSNYAKLESQLKEAEHSSSQKEEEYSEELSRLGYESNEQKAEIKQLKEQVAEKEEAFLSQTDTHAELLMRIDALNKELGQYAKENHDLNLQLMEQKNQDDTFKRQAERKIAELTEASKTVNQMKKMLGMTDLADQAEELSTETTETSEASKDSKFPASNDTFPGNASGRLSMEDSFEQWLNPTRGREFSLLEE